MPGGMSSTARTAKMREAAVRAIELDPLLADAHAAMGVVHARELQWEASERSFRRALELDPTRTSTYTRFSISTLRPLGKNDEAQRLLDTAREQDPLSLDVQLEIGTLEFCAGRFDDAVATLEAVVAPKTPSSTSRGSFSPARSPSPVGSTRRLALFEAMGNRRVTQPGTPTRWSAPAARGGGSAGSPPSRRSHRSCSSPLLSAISIARSRRSSGRRSRMPQRVPLILTYPELAFLRDDPRMAPFRRRFRLP